jgi:hypothetical protein
VDIIAIFLIGMGGEWLWQQASVLGERWRGAVVAAAVLLLLVPALRERQNFYSFNTQWIERTRKALAADEDANAIITTLKELPPGRAHAGLRANWGKALVFGDLKFSDLLTFHRLMPASAPYSSMSLNADLLWHFDDRRATTTNDGVRSLPVAGSTDRKRATCIERWLPLYHGQRAAHAKCKATSSRRIHAGRLTLSKDIRGRGATRRDGRPIRRTARGIRGKIFAAGSISNAARSR